MTKNNPSVGILGAGISGLSTAYALAQKGISATIYEKSDQVGGAIRTVSSNEWIVEEGPNTLMVKSQALWNLFDELGLKKQQANPSAEKRFVVKDQELFPIPTSADSFFSTSLLSAGAKFRLLKEPFIPPSARHDESIATFIQRRFGSEPLNYVVNPFVSGIYAGDPKELSIKHTFSNLWEMEQKHGSFIKGFFKRDSSNASEKKGLISFEGGNQTLPKAMARSLTNQVQLSTEITSIEKQHEQWIIHGNNVKATHDRLISTLPAHALPKIFKSGLFDELADIPYSPMSVLALGFKKSQTTHPLDGFGMLIPEVENFNLLGCLFSSTLFPGRAPAGHHLLTCFIGGARNPKMASKSPEELQSIILDELNQLLGVEGDPVFHHHKFWQKAIPQYIVGYDYYLSLMKEIEKEHSGLYLDGNFRNGVSVPDCISSGFETAQKVQTFFKSL